LDFALQQDLGILYPNLSRVSILVLLDFALQHGGISVWCASDNDVSILVLLDFALQLQQIGIILLLKESFNPCFIGFCSSTCVDELIGLASIMFQSLFYWILLFNQNIYTSSGGNV